MDEHIWRRDLQSQLHRLDSGASVEEQQQQQQESIKKPLQNVKRAIREISHLTLQ